MSATEAHPPLAGSTTGERVYQGEAVLEPHPAPVYRYAIVLKSGKIRFWLQNSLTKKQCRTAELSLEDYVDSTNAIPSGGPSDYFESTTNEEVHDFPIGFYPCENGKFRLKLVVKMHVLKENRVAMYTFDLEPLSLDRIDKLEAEVRRLQQVVENLQSELANRKVEEKQEILHVQGTHKLGDTLLWDIVDGDSKRVTSAIKVDNPGIYQAVVVVNCEWNGSQIKLMKGSECILLVYCGKAKDYPGSTTLSCITRMEKGDPFTVICSANLVATNRLTLVRLGK